MEQLLAKLSQIEAKVHSLRKACKQNNIGITFLNGFNLKKMSDIYSRLQKHYAQNPEKARGLWFQSELKLFNWVLICYSLVSDRKIENFGDEDWGFFKMIFSRKDTYTFKYESKKLLNRDSKNQRTWNTEEDQILTTIMEDPSMKNRWSEVARMFYEASNQRFFRTGKQCREHWLNHLDPSKKHGKWNVSEDLIILTYVISKGKKWSTISKDELSHRTEHMIKNRFKSLLSRFQKTSGISEDNESLLISSLIHKLQNQDQCDISHSNSVKQEEADVSNEHPSISLHQAQVKLENPVKIEQNHVVSEIKASEVRNTSVDLAPQQMSCSNFMAVPTPVPSPLYPTSPTVFGIYYQPSMFCFPIANYWSFCSNNLDSQFCQRE